MSKGIDRRPQVYVRATLKMVELCLAGDDLRERHPGLEYDLYEVTVEQGPEKAFLTWFSRSMVYGLSMSRVGITNQFMDFGHIDIDFEGHTFEFTFDEFFPRWLRAAADEAKAEIANMASKALSRNASA